MRLLRFAPPLAALWFFACGGAETGDAEGLTPSDAGDGTGTGADTDGPVTSTGTGTGTSTGVSTGTGTDTGQGTDGEYVSSCDPAPSPDSLYAHTALSLSLEVVDMCGYAGDVLLIVNTAALCGYTPQYGPLETLNDTYAQEGLAVLGFLSNDFNQAGSDDQIDACTEQYQVEFDQFSLVHVKKEYGVEQHPIFQWLTSQPGMDEEVSWNFNKWLVARDGTLLARWTQATSPDAPEVLAAIEAALDQP
jgi:glutathione peroxidase